MLNGFWCNIYKVDGDLFRYMIYSCLYDGCLYDG